jgi:arabinan endo-1,5-alpha-L-arabinosidase
MKSGFLAKREPVKIAGGNHAAVEGSVIVYFPETGYYYLFVSYGSLSRDYNIRVARSRRIEGPYLDAQGRDMNSASLARAGRAGVKLMGGYRFEPGSGGYKAPGHNSVLIDGEDRFILHHVRSYALPDYWFTMNVRSFAFNRFGWPVVSPLRYEGGVPEAAALPGGDYLLIGHGENTSAASPVPLSVRLESGRLEPGTIAGSSQGTYRVYDGFRMELILDGKLYDGVVLRQAGSQGQEHYAFTLMSEDGFCIWGLQAEAGNL